MNLFFKYLWFLIVTLALVAALHLMGWADEGSRTLDPIPDHVRQRN